MNIDLKSSKVLHFKADSQRGIVNKKEQGMYDQYNAQNSEQSKQTLNIFQIIANQP